MQPVHVASGDRQADRRAQFAETLAAAFVDLLFDMYAPRFDTALMDQPGYRGPQMLRDALDRAGVGRVSHALDLGCGTGLTGDVLRPRCDRLSGIDISARMLAGARARQIYDDLSKADIGTLEIGAHYDLIAANEVFNYLGALERVIGWCAGSLGPAGTLVFTVEQGEQGCVLHESRRFRHARRYVTDLLAEAGFTRVEVTPDVLRYDRGAPIPALVVTAQGQSRHASRQSDGESEIAA